MKIALRIWAGGLVVAFVVAVHRIIEFSNEILGGKQIANVISIACAALLLNYLLGFLTEKLLNLYHEFKEFEKGV